MTKQTPAKDDAEAAFEGYVAKIKQDCEAAIITEEDIADYEAAFEAAIGLAVEQALAEAEPEQTIRETARRAALILAGTHPRMVASFPAGLCVIGCNETLPIGTSGRPSRSPTSHRRWFRRRGHLDHRDSGTALSRRSSARSSRRSTRTRAWPSCLLGAIERTGGSGAINCRRTSLRLGYLHERLADWRSMPESCAAKRNHCLRTER